MSASSIPAWPSTRCLSGMEPHPVRRQPPTSDKMEQHWSGTRHGKPPFCKCKPTEVSGPCPLQAAAGDGTG